MKFYGYYQVQFPNTEVAEKAVKNLNNDIIIGEARWHHVGQGAVENAFKVDWLDCFEYILMDCRRFDTSIVVHFFQDVIEDTEGDWNAAIGYYDDGEAYCRVREAYIDNIKWTAEKDILEDIEQTDIEVKEDLF